MFRSATFKLTMWYLALAMAISLIFSFALYRVTTAELAHGLHRETQRIYTEYPVFNNSPILQPDSDYTSSAHIILIRLISFNIFVLLGAGIASYWLARRTLEPIEAAHEQQKRFTADVSHELRTPLTALKMESEVALMNNKLGVKDLRAILESNLEEAAKLEELINNLLRLTRLEADELQQNFETVDLKKVAEKAIEDVSKLSQYRKVKINKNLKSIKIQGDENSLIQLVVILLDNSIKYSSSGGEVNVKVSLENNKATIVVSDEGIGIDPIALEKVFERFYRADNSRTKSDIDGTGLGLSIADMIVDIHKGNIELSSQVGKGTTATVSLPQDIA